MADRGGTPGRADAAHIEPRRLRRLQCALGALWLADGLLALQPSLLHGGLALGIEENAMGQPGALAHLLVALGRVVARHDTASALAVAAVQLGLGAAILLRRTRRLGLALSVPWALAVWAGGEGFGMLASGYAMLPSGAPGAALLYGLATIVVYPGAPSARARTAWTGLWLLAAGLQVVPVVSLGFKLRADLGELADGQPAALAALDHRLGAAAGGHGQAVTAVLVALEVAVALAGVLDGRWRAWPLRLGALSCALFWLAGENAGGLLSGSASDVGTMPLVVLLAFAALPAETPLLARTRRVAGAGRPAGAPAAVSGSPAPALAAGAG
ncbi:MAG TPA: hypothetical protein VMU75_04770 [Acidimicrobiales bacterium]|nr:hypothetical protein [Acidimicrobiales bacterium]